MDKNKNREGFNIPKDYFDEFEARLFSKLNEDKLPKESGFKSPEGYFEQLNSVIIKKIEGSSKNTKVITIFSKKTITYALAIASCAILVFSLAKSKTSLTDINSIEISSIEKYLEEGNLQFDSNDIASLLEEEDLNSNLSGTGTISEEILEAYLLEYIDDTTILIE